MKSSVYNLHSFKVMFQSKRDGQEDGRKDDQPDRQRQFYIPLPSTGDNNSTYR